MAGSTPLIRTNLRRFVAVHEAGHAAMSLLLGQGHQEGVTIVASERFAGCHAVGGQLGLARLPRFVVLREAIKQVLVSLAGPMAEAAVIGEVFDVDDFFADDEQESDAAHVRAGLTVIERHIGRDERMTMVHIVADLLARTVVQDLIQAVTATLVRRGQIGGAGLALIHDRHPTDPEWIRLPSTIAAEWLSAV